MSDLAFSSIVVRLCIISLFFASSANKFIGGLDGLEAFFVQVFSKTWIPLPLVKMYAAVVPYIEVLICVWLLSGWKLKLAWAFTALFLLSLAFGLSVAQNFPGAFQDYCYVMICLVGFYLANHDMYRLDRP